MKIKKILPAFALVFLLTACGKAGTEYTDQAMTAVMQEDFISASSYFETALSKGEDKELIYRGMGLACMGQQDYAGAVTYFKQALNYADLSPDALEYDINYYMAVSYYKLGEYDDAVAVYDAIINLKPKDETAFFMRGTMKLYMADSEGAKADFDKAIELKPKDFSLCLDAYEAMTQCGYIEDAQTYMNRVAMAEEKNVTDYDRGRVRYYQGDYNTAINYLELARKGEAGNNAKMIKMLGECYEKTGNFSHAVSVYEGYVELNKDPAMYNQIGLCYAKQGDYTNAIRAFQNGQLIIDNNTCMQTLKINEIVCYEYMHDYKTAREKLEAYLQIYPTTAEIGKEWCFLVTR